MSKRGLEQLSYSSQWIWGIVAEASSPSPFYYLRTELRGSFLLMSQTADAQRQHTWGQRARNLVSCRVSKSSSGRRYGPNAHGGLTCNLPTLKHRSVLFKQLPGRSEKGDAFQLLGSRCLVSPLPPQRGSPPTTV